MSGLEEALESVGNSRVLVLSEASTDVERSIIEQALRTTDGRIDVVAVDDASLDDKLDIDDVAVLPVRVVWLPEERNGRRRIGIRDLLTLENPRRPREATQAKLVAEGTDRYRVIAGEPALVGELRRRRLDHTGADGGSGTFADFVRRRAVLALDRAERSLVGDQHKVPRLVAEEISDSARFRDETAALARSLGRPAEEVFEEACRALDQVVASQSRLATDVFDTIFAPMYERAWEIDVDTSMLERLRELNRERGLVFLPAHRSYADPLVLSRVLREAGFPRNHLPGGTNLSFWPVGPIARRAGIIYIPRTLKGDEVTKLVLREYLGFLAAKRFNLEWYMEAGRSRTGKLRAPRFGLLQFVVDALRSGRVDDVVLVPVSFTYDRLPEVALMAAEEQGMPKQAEGLGWLARYIKANANLLGNVHVRFGEPMSLRDGLDAAEALGADHRLAMQKVGFEVFNRINDVTPITPMALVAMALLGTDGRALTDTEVLDVVTPFVDYLEARALPLTDRTAVVDIDGIRRTLQRLESAGIVTRHADGTESVYVIEPGQHHSAAFYRNSAIHWFVNRAIIEVAIAMAVEDPGGDRVATAWQHCLDLRDLLKFEFFFSSKRDYYNEMMAERELLGVEDDADLPTDAAGGRAILEQAGFLAAPIVLRPFLEAYYLVTERLAERDPRKALDEKKFIAECASVGRQYLLQHRLRNPESVSPELFAGALKLVANRDLYDPGREGVGGRRRILADEVARMLRAVDDVERIDRERQRRRLDPAAEQVSAS